MTIQYLDRFTKDPKSILKYTLDWTDALTPGDTINSVTFTTSSGLTVASQTYTDDTATAILSGGAENSDYDVECLINTAAGERDVRTFQIRVRQR